MQVAAVHPRFGTAGSFNVTVQFEGELRGGRAQILPQAYKYDRTGRPFVYQTYAEVASVRPSSGPLAGGTTVTITGRGFPILGLGLGDTVVVKLYGVPCSVLSSNYSTVVCRSGPAPVAQPPAYAAALRGQYPGMRGAEYEFYSNVTGLGISGLWNLNATITTESAAPGSYKTALMDVVEAQE